MIRNILLCIFVVTWYCALFANKQCNSLIQKGDTLYSQYKNTIALTIYSEAHKRCPQNYEAFYKYVRALNDVGEDKNDTAYYTKTMEYADSVILHFPDSLMGYFLKAAASGNMANAVTATKKVKVSRIVKSNIDKALEVAPNYAPSHVIIGAYYQQVASANWFLKQIAQTFLGGLPDGTYDDALRHLKRALELEPNNIFAHLEIAKLYIKLGQNKNAKQHLHNVLQIPNNDNQATSLKKTAQMLLKSLSN